MNGIMNNVQHNMPAFVLGAVLNVLAVVDVAGLVDYLARAVAGGIVWLVFKLLADYLSKRINKENGKKDNGTNR